MSLPLIASPTSSTNNFRKARFKLVRSLVDAILTKQGKCTILDVGGTPEYWLAFGNDLLKDERISISVINISYSNSTENNVAELQRVQRLTGDARHLDGIADKSIDLVHSNSVIEHVGRWADMSAMASEIRRVGNTHYVQTPYWGFPMEPHNRSLFFHWFPEQSRYRLVMKKKRGFWPRANSVDEAMKLVQSNSLLDRRQFGALFNTSSIYSEIVYGMTKSLIAVGGANLPIHKASNTRRLRI